MTDKALKNYTKNELIAEVERMRGVATQTAQAAMAAFGSSAIRRNMIHAMQENAKLKDQINAMEIEIKALRSMPGQGRFICRSCGKDMFEEEMYDD
jgi:hypothetical protein